MYRYYRFDEEIKHNCPNCGAPITTEICPYCDSKTGLEEDISSNDIPTIECKEATADISLSLFTLIFFFAFGFAGFVMPIIISQGQDGWTTLKPVEYLIFLPFAAVSIGSLIAFLLPFIRKIQVKLFGKEIEGEVHSYINDSLRINGVPAQVLRVLIETDEGPRYIKYELGTTQQPFKVNEKIKLRVYKDMFYIKAPKKYFF